MGHSISGHKIWTELMVKEKKYFKNDHFANLKTSDANTKTESYRIETLEAKAPNR
jgi:23S rRNA maturation mini-RNase III